MVKLTGGEIDVSSGTGFRGETALAIVRLTAQATDGAEVTLYLSPAEARAVGLDLIGGAHSAIADAHLRILAKRDGLDGDGLLTGLRTMTDDALGPG